MGEWPLYLTSSISLLSRCSNKLCFDCPLRKLGGRAFNPEENFGEELMPLTIAIRSPPEYGTVSAVEISIKTGRQEDLVSTRRPKSNGSPNQLCYLREVLLSRHSPQQYSTLKCLAESSTSSRCLSTILDLTHLKGSNPLNLHTGRVQSATNVQRP